MHVTHPQLRQIGAPWFIVRQIMTNSRDPQEMGLSILAEVLKRIETRTA